MKLRIEVNTGRLRAKYAEVERLSNGRYRITLNEKNTPFQNALAALHEWCHILAWEFIPFNDDDREHGFIKAMEKSFKRHWKKWWRGE